MFGVHLGGLTESDLLPRLCEGVSLDGEAKGRVLRDFLCDLLLDRPCEPTAEMCTSVSLSEMGMSLLAGGGIRYCRATYCTTVVSCTRYPSRILMATKAFCFVLGRPPIVWILCCVGILKLYPQEVW